NLFLSISLIVWECKGTRLFFVCQVNLKINFYIDFQGFARNELIASGFRLCFQLIPDVWECKGRLILHPCQDLF
ncbi:hypothetical protein, partial [Spirosoma fluviale]|uniref:hypothetical protein n=1 Tax=Spirosoma fluviale TaxID=1597977 RepID=UPI001C54047C